MHYVDSTNPKKSFLKGPKISGNYLTTTATFGVLNALYISLLDILITGYVGMCLYNFCFVFLHTSNIPNL